MEIFADWRNYGKVRRCREKYLDKGDEIIRTIERKCLSERKTFAWEWFSWNSMTHRDIVCPIDINVAFLGWKIEIPFRVLDRLWILGFLQAFPGPWKSITSPFWARCEFYWKSPTRVQNWWPFNFFTPCFLVECKQDHSIVFQGESVPLESRQISKESIREPWILWQTFVSVLRFFSSPVQGKRRVSETGWYHQQKEG
jgi:hypothetical protein